MQGSVRRTPFCEGRLICELISVTETFTLNAFKKLEPNDRNLYNVQDKFTIMAEWCQNVGPQHAKSVPGGLLYD